MASLCYKNFTGGEICTDLAVRYDLARYGTSVAKMQNMVPTLHGGVMRRAGLKFTADLGEYSVLWSFSYSSDAEHNYVLIFSEKRLRIALHTGEIIAGIDLSTPYAAADLPDLSLAQCGDVVYIAHPDYTLRKITRSGIAPNYNWVFAEVALNASLNPPAKASCVFVKNNGGDTAELTYQLQYKVSAVDKNGVESLPSQAATCKGKHPSDWVTGNHVNISWQAVSGAAEYNIYREDAGYFGFIGVAEGLTFTDSNYEADTGDTPREDWAPFADGNNPSTVVFHEQRLFIGGAKKNPTTLYASRTGNFEDFRKSRPLKSDDPIEVMIASGSIDDIRWMASFGELLIGTSGGEYKAFGADGAVTPSDCRILSQSYWGSGRLSPITVGNAVLHRQRHGGRVRNLQYSLETDGYAGTDLAVLAPHLFEGYHIVQWAFQQSASRVWCVRNDGVLLCLTYMQEQSIWGWSEHITDGKFKSVTVIEGDSGDVAAFVVERIVGGKSRYFLELGGEDFTGGAVSGRTASGSGVATSGTGVTTSGGAASGVGTFGVTRSGGVTSGVGTSDGVTSGSGVATSGTGFANALFLDSAVTENFSAPTDKLTGLDRLAGKTVSALVDGKGFTGLTVADDGTVQLPVAGNTVTAGLPYTSILALLPLESDTKTGSTIGKPRAYGECLLRVKASAGGEYSSAVDGIFYPFSSPLSDGTPYSGDISFVPGSTQAADTTVCVRTNAPYPFYILAIIVNVTF